MDNSKPDVFSYLDYRQYLSDLLKSLKCSGKQYTQRALLTKMNVTSTGFLANVINKKKNLNEEHAQKLANALPLSQIENQRFLMLIRYNQATNLLEKKEHLDHLTRVYKTKIKHLKPQQFSLFSQWYYVYIRELINFYPFNGDYQALGYMLNPAIPPRLAKKAIIDLLDMGLVVCNPDGSYAQSNPMVSTGNEVKSVALASFQVKTMELARQALLKTNAKNRDISVVSATLSQESFLKVKAEIQYLRKRILDIAAEENSPDTVYQCNFQLFPVTKTYTKNASTHQPE